MFSAPRISRQGILTAARREPPALKHVTPANRIAAMSALTVYLETFGCQMNVLDSELIVGALRRRGYEPCARADQADVVLFNTCSVRLHAEQKVYARLGDLIRVKRDRPEMIIGVLGCMAQRGPDEIATTMRHVDLIVGPAQLDRLPDLIEQARATRRRIVAVREGKSHASRSASRADAERIEQLDLSRDPDTTQAQAYVRVQRGCDNFCTYCVVPHVRGPEESRPPENIVAEVRKIADAGIRQVTLLGQTVSNYRYGQGSPVGLADLLERIHDIDGLDRIRFVTSYPGQFDRRILAAMRDLTTVCEFLHIPAQSGADRILKAMNRKYTVAEYDALIEDAYDTVPNVSLVGDFIVGFPGETDADFAATCELVRRTRYKNIFVFRYSPRPGTAADRHMTDDVPDEVKQHRNSVLLDIQRDVSLTANQALIGQTVAVLVEGPSKAAIAARATSEPVPGGATWRRADQLTGRNRGDQVVVFAGPDHLAGQLVNVTIRDASSVTLYGDLATGAS